ncbi:sensor histidine kinase [Sphingobacterium wenxiniae]|uniref:GHKL domain-containing protein n=1 Tax=Sphingobacterium wenxiniae TaxID=683125 RepID=A0A1I6SQR4_9SPHI|nr:histidine kinase [Sphingobacterium wenxiniae]SFS79256.1 GHKL domain-containing protein [Sphingobacterium wenxiniae]
MEDHFYWLIIIAIGIAASCALWIMYRKIQDLTKRNKSLLEQKETERNSFHPDLTPYKLDPHLLKNALNAIQSHAYHSYHALDKLSNVLDYILYESDEKLVKLKDEINFAQNLIEINRLKVSPLFDLHMRTKITPEAGNLMIAPFITINPIENAFKHADLQNENSFISVVFEATEDTVLLSVSNKIKENTMAKGTERGGIGNRSFKNRLDKLYGNRYTLVTEQKDDVYHVKVEIKLSGND